MVVIIKINSMIFYKLLLAILAMSHGTLTVDVNKLFSEKDLSEYCKRGVIPSIFLGSNVVEASSFILHFTKLNLPYSCYISVRSETGSNIIMVITLPPPGDATLSASCATNNPQLLVYEMGETFGGYWGMLPEVMLKPKPPGTKYYTLKTTQTTTEPTEPITEEHIETASRTPTPYVGPKEAQEYIRVEVPIVDVSAALVPGSEQPTQAIDFEEVFDSQYDVTPIPGVKYATSMLPLVQFNVKKQTDDGRRGFGQEPRYELDIAEEFTPDPRFKLPIHNERHRTNINRRLTFGRNRATKVTFYKNYRSTTKRNTFTKYVFPTTMRFNKKPKQKHAGDSWEIIDKLIESLKNNKDYEGTKDFNDSKDTPGIAEIISNKKHNSTIYLKSILSVSNDDKLISNNLLPFTTKRTIAPLPRSTVGPSKKQTIEKSESIPITRNQTQITKNIHPVSSHNKKTEISSITIASTSISSQSSESIPINITDDRLIIELTSQRNGTTREASITSNSIGIHKETVPPISLVNHESWENIVQAAPSMAVLLNQSVPYNVVNKRDGYWSSLNETYRKELLERKKRAIQAIAIDSGRPHTMSTKTESPTTTKGPYNVGDMQEFARLVELQDDDINGRVALRYLKQYVGPAIYNICGEAMPFNRHVFLFNSSRIVLSLNNFTLSSISVIITSARTLVSNELQCPSWMLECQVSGARVCVDSLSACDGVPNCGSYDIYDEDRLMCGAGKSLQHNVYLAAVTFLAFMLSSFYAVHYWLKRCVPKVAEAFFVYTDGAENILYLDSIMRPPREYDDDGSRMYYKGSIYTGGITNEELTDDFPKTTCTSLLKKCILCFCFWKKAEKEVFGNVHEHDTLMQGQRKIYSFTQMELSNMLVRPKVETSVQTGDSLEMTMFEEKNNLQMTANKNTVDIKNENEKFAVKSKTSAKLIRDSLLTLDESLPEDELSLMKFFRNSRSDSIDSIIMRETPRTMLDFSAGAALGLEKEISNIMYDGGIRTNPGPSGVNQKPKAKIKAKGASRSRKRIRFEEATTMIPVQILSDDEEVKPRRQKQVLSLVQPRSWRNQHLSPIKEDDESGSRHRHFWESKKKKTSMTPQISLRYSSSQLKDQ